MQSRKNSIVCETSLECALFSPMYIICYTLVHERQQSALYHPQVDFMYEVPQLGHAKSDERNNGLNWYPAIRYTVLFYRQLCRAEPAERKQAIEYVAKVRRNCELMICKMYE